MAKIETQEPLQRVFLCMWIQSNVRQKQNTVSCTLIV